MSGDTADQGDDVDPDDTGTDDTTWFRSIGCTNNPNVGVENDCFSGECDESQVEDTDECDAYDGFSMDVSDSQACPDAQSRDYALTIQRVEGTTIVDKYYLGVNCEGGVATLTRCASGIGSLGTDYPFSCE